MGYNPLGALGDGTFTMTNQPEKIVDSGVVAIAGGSYFSLFAKSDGSLWAMGDDYYGQLGDGTNAAAANGYVQRSNVPKQVMQSGVIAVAAGDSHSLVLESDGSLWTMGYNNFGQLGDGTLNATNRPELIVATGVVAIAARHNHSLFVKSDGSLWGMGDNLNGDLGDGFTTISARVEQIYPTPSLLLRSAISSGTNLLLRAGCPFAGNFALLSSTNFALPLGQWTPILTNSVTASRSTNNFSTTLTNVFSLGAPQQFYILRSQ